MNKEEGRGIESCLERRKKTSDSAQGPKEIACELAVSDLLSLAQSDAPERNETTKASAEKIRVAIIEISNHLYQHGVRDE